MKSLKTSINSRAVLLTSQQEIIWNQFLNVQLISLLLRNSTKE
jgi:hypothetical protein